MFDIHDRIHISAGLPCVSVLPFSRIINQMSLDLSKEKDPNLLQYGFSSGYPRFKRILANFIGGKERRILNPENLFITNGATHGILLSIISLSGGRASVIMERPTYFPMIDLFKELNLSLHFADMDSEGISVDMILSHLRTIPHEENVFIHVTPFFQNPTGVCMSKDRARKLVEIIKENKNTWLLVDNVYKYLNFAEIEYDDILSKDLGRIINIGSFSKIFGPGVRLGWIEAEKSVIEKISESGYVQSSGGFNPISARLMEGIIQNQDMNMIIEIWVKFLKRKQKELVTELRDIFPKSSFRTPAGGYYIWTDLKEDLIADDKFRQFAKDKKGIVFVPGIKCAGDSNHFRTYLRFGFATYKDDELITGIKKLKEAIIEFNASGHSALGHTINLPNESTGRK
ncbi:MAG: PLP-dependent aminotransferase family protein [Patescibacteria group bacterium]